MKLIIKTEHFYITEMLINTLFYTPYANKKLMFLKGASLKMTDCYMVLNNMRASN